MTPSVTAITTFNADGLELYGRAAIRSFLKHWPDPVRLVVYTEGFDLEVGPRLQAVDLNAASPRLRIFKNHYSKQPMACGQTLSGYDYNFDAVRFSHKMFAMFAAARDLETDYLLWLDGDVASHADIPRTFIPEIMDGMFAAYLGRKGKHSETGFLCFDMRHREAGAFFETMERIYISGELFKMNAWHDSEVFDVSRTIFEAQGKIRTRDLSANLMTFDPFSESILSTWMNHQKGGRKLQDDAAEQTPAVTAGSPRRYSQILRLIETFHPGTIVEVGTWNGRHAMKMAQLGLRFRDKLHYTGYDLFEAATTESDAAELNGKAPVIREVVEAGLARFAASNPGFSWRLVAGNSLETLEEQRADLCFIDGGHAVATIASDFSRLRSSDIIVFDDFYVSGADTAAFGCNTLLQDIPHLILPVIDRFANGLAIALAVTAPAETLARIAELFPEASGKTSP